MEQINLRKAVIYCRVSTKEQVDEGGSLATQEKVCFEFALKNGYEIIEKFIEQGESAKTANRPELRRLMEFCSIKKNGITAVIAYKIDRVSRNIDDYRQIRLGLKLHGVEIKSSSEYFEDTPAGRFMENIIANVAQFDNDVRTERSVGGMRDALREGRFVWQAPIGYANVKIGGKAAIMPDAMAPLVRLAFEEVAKNHASIEEVYDTVTKAGLLNKRGKHVSRSYFRLMLSNELYAGWIVGLGERNKGTFDALVSLELFEQVQRVILRRKHKTLQYKRDNEDFPLRRFIVHPSGKKLTGCWSRGRTKKYAYYRYHIKGCDFKRQELENAFMAFFDQFRLTNKQFAKLQSKVEKNLIKGTLDAKKDIELKHKYVDELKAKQKALIQKNLDGVISDNILRDQLELIEDEMTKNYIPPTSEVTVNVDKSLEKLRDYFKKPSSFWLIAPLRCQLKLQWFNFPQGIIFDGEKLRTTEICNIFKAESDFSDSDSHWVHPTLPSSNQNETPSPQYWDKIGSEIETLAGIIQEIETETQSSKSS